MTDANMRFPQGGISITALAADFAVMMFKGSLPCRLPFLRIWELKRFLVLHIWSRTVGTETAGRPVILGRIFYYML